MNQVMVFSDPLNGSWPPQGALKCDNIEINGVPIPPVGTVVVIR